MSKKSFKPLDEGLDDIISDLNLIISKCFIKKIKLALFPIE